MLNKFQAFTIIKVLILILVTAGWPGLASLLPVSSFPSVGRVSNFLGSILWQQRFEMADQCYSSVTAQSFIQQTKGSTPWRQEGRSTPRERPQSILALSFCSFCLLSPCKLGLALFHLKFSLPLQSADFLLFCYCGLFPLSFSHHHFRLLFPFLTT